jgi:queuosine precursor transporter
MIPSGSIYLVGLYVACELTANITATKTISLFGLNAPGGVFIYAITFTLIDLINERLGKAGARKVVVAGFLANLVLALYTTVVVSLPSPAFYGGQQAFASVLGSTPRIIAASLAAYLISSMIDVEIFARWRDRMGVRHKWARVLASNSVSTLVDSALFVVLAFAGTLPVLPLVAGQYILKMAITVVSLPLIYLSGKGTKQESMA